jgi:hypothetical protein
MNTPLTDQPKTLRFRDEFVDFWHFLQRPTIRRLPGRRLGGSLFRDWWPGISVGRLFAWAGVLWLLNFLLLGPLAVMAADSAGASHRLDTANIPWAMAILWAPIVEELLFRYGLRRPRQALWVCPTMVPPLLWGMQGWTIAWVAVVIGLICLSLRPGRIKRTKWKMDWRRYYHWRFPWVFHLSAVIFAGVHLQNFRLLDTDFWLLPLLVLPQWSAGLVIGWMRVRRGIGAAILLHSLFNTGPIIVILFMLKQMA